MITPADDFDDGPDLDRPEPDDPLTVILRPPAGHLAPPPGRYEEIRRGASRRRLLRTAAGVGATCAVAALAVLLPLRPTTHEPPARPTVPLAPAPASSPSTGPDPSADAVPSAVPEASAAERRGTPTPSKASRASEDARASDAPTSASDVERSTTPRAPSSAPSASSTRR
ncbi:hypothetical protein [Streptomyces sp. NBC_00582]|uniref:hypothetical protein n=1 Tax=Streptomyces sp. NBC_00582 TaxID=2975783 RepID=UPI002E81238F|nr:hypothetical protein [Streptomyces sp. NBC_00582]WUB61659.1 hypothetical protein OG852_15275 [Streptomyces sp. NBC_00582]